ARGLVLGDAAFDTRHHFVLDTDVGEGAAHHDFMVAPARAVGVEVLLRDAVFQQILAGGAVLLDGARGRDVVGSDRVTQDRHGTRTANVGHGLGRRGHAHEVWRVGDVG